MACDRKEGNKETLWHPNNCRGIFTNVSMHWGLLHCTFSAPVRKGGRADSPITIMRSFTRKPDTTGAMPYIYILRQGLPAAGPATWSTLKAL